ncbi:hypothetical protein EGH25_00970 [Haladaptatus sp. F3-133]|jgi:hypothetical protein|uniref:Uncharacterized protein n=1 Tax=Halorutilus salinus TaxID=2487751 RepID=A0A9Q4C2M5_9EURY|nr:hypothetical protein [Halorutilus salinus]MCX2817931.1 hypothetical protein [Halorutilus salinus]
MRKTTVFMAVLVAVGMVAAVANPAAAWGSTVHEGTAQEAADAGGAPSFYQDDLVDKSMWGDEVGTGCCEGDTFGVDKEYNPWYQGAAEFTLDTAGVDLPVNADHWLAVNAYQMQFGDSWDVAQYEPIGTGHYNAAEFTQNGRDAGYSSTAYDRVGKAQHYLQDLTVPYHTAAIDNLGYGTYDGEGDFNHLHYEAWAGDVYGQYDFAEHTEDGVKSAWDVEVTSKDDFEELVADAAAEANNLASNVDGTGEWEDNVWATQEIMHIQGKYTAILYDYGTDDTYYELEYNGNVDTTSDDGGGWWSF